MVTFRKIPFEFQKEQRDLKKMHYINYEVNLQDYSTALHNFIFQHNNLFKKFNQKGRKDVFIRKSLSIPVPPSNISIAPYAHRVAVVYVQEGT